VFLCVSGTKRLKTGEKQSKVHKITTLVPEVSKLTVSVPELSQNGKNSPWYFKNGKISFKVLKLFKIYNFVP
jgi:hypothetical protein